MVKSHRGSVAAMGASLGSVFVLGGLGMCRWALLGAGRVVREAHARGDRSSFVLTIRNMGGVVPFTDAIEEIPCTRGASVFGLVGRVCFSVPPRWADVGKSGYDQHPTGSSLVSTGQMSPHLGL